jgi:hypothetical protein
MMKQAEPDPFEARSEDVPLTEIPTQDSLWHERYKKYIANAIHFCEAFGKQAVWEYVEPPSSEQDDRGISLFERPVTKNGFYSFQVTGVLDGRADRYFYILNDHQQATRGKWDTEDVLGDMEQYETYCSDEGKITVVQSTIKSPAPHIIAHRFLFGVKWSDYACNSDSYVIVFQTCGHPMLTMPADGRVAAHATLKAKIESINDGKQSILTLSVYIHPRGSSAFMGIYINKYKERLRQRMYLYERVVAEWDRYYGPDRDPKVSGTEAREKLFD